MATKKISELEAISTADDSDVLVVVDVSEGTTNKITKGNLLIGSGHTVEMSIDSDYKLTLVLKNAAGTALSTQTVDLPNENAITNITYSNGNLILTKQSGGTSTVDISGLITGLVTETDFNTFVTTIKSVIGISTNTYNSSSTYNTGDIVVQNEKIYKAKQDNITGTFDSSKWDEISLYEYQKIQDNKIEENYEEITELKEKIERYKQQLPRVEDEGYDATLDNTIEDDFLKFDLEGNCVQDGTPTLANPIDIESAGDGGTINEKIINKNWLPITASSTANDEITFTVDSDGTVKVNGTPSETTFFTIYNMNMPVGGKVLNGCPSGGSSSTYELRGTDTTNHYISDFGNGATFNENVILKNVIIRIQGGYAANNLVFKPMISNEGGEYNPHKETIYTIPVQAPFKGIGNVRDVFFKNTPDSPYYNENLTLNGWYEKHNIKEITLNGTESVLREGTYTSGYYRFNIAVDFAIDYGEASYTPKILCDKLVAKSRNDLYLNNEGIGTTKSDNVYRIALYIDATKEMTTTELKAWLESNNLTVNVVSEPTYLLCTAAQTAILENLPHTEKGQTNVYSIDEVKAYMKVAGVLDLNTLVTRVEILESES